MLVWGTVSLCGAAPVRPSAGQPTPAEKYVLDQIAAGKVANLEEAFPDETSRIVRAVFLEELLTGVRKDCVIHRNGVQIEGAIVREPVDLRNAEITHDTRLIRCRFDGAVNLSKCIFENGFSVAASIFSGPVNGVAMKVGLDASLQDAKFRGPVNFAQLETTGVLMAGGASFLNPDAPAEFNSLKAGGNVFFTNAIFAGPAHFQHSHIADSFKLDGARFTNGLALASFEAMKVAGAATFNGASFSGYVSFKDARLYSLNLTEVNWPNQPYGEWLWLNGMTYQRVMAGTEKDSWRNLLVLVDRAAHRTAYSIDIYSGLAEFYRREGYPGQANRFFIAQKRREREEVLRGTQWAWSLFLDWFVGYGRSPERALFWSAAMILFGVAVFRPQRMEPRTTNLKTDHYSPFWYSMDLFLPLIKLQDVDMWKPREDSRFARFWSRLHTMLGWALIPIAVAAWTGMFEK
jgi:hypothetical protein